jgi:phosphatidylglycerol:prolipoprotein diacylglycerol transferase
MALWARSARVAFFPLMDFVAPLVPIGLGTGRLGNFINGELWGRPTDVPWAVIVEGTPRHPSQLYEAGLEGLLLLAWTQWRLWKTDAWKTPGRITGEFLVLYAVVRIAGEQFREPDAGLLLGLSRGVFYSLFVLLAGLLVLATRKRA